MEFENRKNLKRSTAVVLLVAAVATITGCSLLAPPIALQDPTPSDPVLGDPPPSESTVSVAELIRNPDEHVGEEVVVRGVILAQCTRGCTFTLDDGSGVVRVELVDDAVLDPLSSGSVGRSIEARGIFLLRPDPVLVLSSAESWRYVQ